jgi:hypothetical protein
MRQTKPGGDRRQCDDTPRHADRAEFICSHSSSFVEMIAKSAAL